MEQSRSTPWWIWVVIVLLGFIGWQLYEANISTSRVISTPTPMLTDADTTSPELLILREDIARGMYEDYIAELDEPDEPSDEEQCADPNVRIYDWCEPFYRDDECPRGCTERKPNCVIKGNINQDTGEKIYHMPGDKYYEKTRIHPRFGERWFCTPDEAEANEWRRAGL